MLRYFFCPSNLSNTTKKATATTNVGTSNLFLTLSTRPARPYQLSYSILPSRGLKSSSMCNSGHNKVRLCPRSRILLGFTNFDGKFSSGRKSVTTKLFKIAKRICYIAGWQKCVSNGCVLRLRVYPIIDQFHNNSQEIIIAVRSELKQRYLSFLVILMPNVSAGGSPDPNLNAALSVALKKAKAQGLPKANIDKTLVRVRISHLSSFKFRGSKCSEPTGN